MVGVSTVDAHCALALRIVLFRGFSQGYEKIKSANKLGTKNFI